mmetsp:Transcript_58505/g.119090  ORF Transcript_58505/g.119090 Transcript_58505/m.119090 type:complete len:255 (+) Transcript_58505:180-944(+)
MQPAAVLPAPSFHFATVVSKKARPPSCWSSFPARTSATDVAPAPAAPPAPERMVGGARRASTDRMNGAKAAGTWLLEGGAGILLLLATSCGPSLCFVSGIPLLASSAALELAEAAAVATTPSSLGFFAPEALGSGAAACGLLELARACGGGSAAVSHCPSSHELQQRFLVSTATCGFASEKLVLVMKGKEWASECGTVLPDKTTFGPVGAAPAAVPATAPAPPLRRIAAILARFLARLSLNVSLESPNLKLSFM